MRLIILHTVLMLLITTMVFADPTSVSVSESVTHESSFSVSGSGFGSKSPVAPLWWDNIEGATDGSTTFTSGELSWVTSGTLSGTGKHYSQAVPSGSETSANITYRNVNYRSTPGPHQYSSKYATGAHWQFENNTPQYSDSGYDNIILTVDSGTANKDIWVVFFKYTLDPNWTLLNNFSNHKMTAINYGTTAYDGPAGGGNFYGTHSRPYCPGYTTQHNTVHTINSGLATCGDTEGSGPNPSLAWVGYNILWDSPDASNHEVWKWAGDGSNSGRTNYLTSPSGCNNAKNDTRSYSIGGWFCTNICTGAEEDKRGHQDNFKYFDDIYMDNTYSRVVLANSSTYSSATIVEPQIPSAWSDTSITVTANLGALTGDTAYLFVFDAENDANATGVAVTLSESGTIRASGSITIGPAP